MNNILEFLKGFAATKPKPVKIGDRCRNKETGVHSICLNIQQGLYYGRLPDTRLTMSNIENIEKI